MVQECIINIGLRPPFHGSSTFHHRTSTLNSIDISMDPPRYNQVLDFIAILGQSDPAFQSYNYSIQHEYPSIQRDKVTQINSKSLPTIADVVAHLKLLKLLVH